MGAAGAIFVTTGGPEPIGDSLARVAAQGSAAITRLRDELERLGAEIHSTIEPGPHHGAIDFYELSRHLLYAAISLTDETRREARQARRTGAKAAAAKNLRWQHLLEPYRLLAARAGGAFAHIPNEDSVRSYARLETRSWGVGEKRFYSCLAILVVHLHEQKLLASELFQKMCPEDEVLLPVRIRSVLDGIIDAVEGKPPRSSEKTKPRLPEHVMTAPEIWIRFPYAAHRLQLLTDFQNGAKFGKGGEAHFVIYRPMRSDPCRLIKSFLILAPPQVDHDLSEAEHELSKDEPQVLEGRPHDVFNFRHYYRPPGRPARQRVSIGRAVPLEQGLYLVGGQRVRANSPSFSALKVIALPWNDIEYEEQVIKGLAISTNFDGDQIASRVAMRATPIEHSNNLRVGTVHVDDVFEDLRVDAELERRLINQVGGSSSAEIEETAFAAMLTPPLRDDQLLHQATSISAYCNNIRESGWDVLPGFRRGDVAMDRAQLESELRGFLESSDPIIRQRREGEEIFSLGAIRIGPLAHD